MQNTIVSIKPASLGSISHGTLRTEDLLSAFASTLEDMILLNGDYFSLPEHREERDKLNNLVGESQERSTTAAVPSRLQDRAPADYLVEELQNALEQFAPPYCYFGAHEGDGSDFGYWPDMFSINELPQISDNSAEAIAAEQSENYSTDVRYVNDHGNVTVYGADGSVLLELV